MVLCYSEPEQLHHIAHYAFTDAQPVDPDFILPTVDELNMSLPERSIEKWALDKPLGYLASLVREVYDEHEKAKNKGVVFRGVDIQELNVHRRYDGRDISVSKIGTIGVRPAPTDTQIYLLDWSHAPTRAMMLGFVPVKSEFEDEYVNMAPVLPDELSIAIAKFGLSRCYRRMTSEEFHH